MIRRFSIKILSAAAIVLAALSVCALLTVSAGAGTSARHDPLSVRPFYVQHGSPAAVSERSFRKHGQAADAKLIGRIAGQPQALWLNSWDSVSWLDSALARARGAHRLLTFVVYFIPQRDCGSYSSGGASSAAQYRQWIRKIASHLGRIPTAAIVEPDALAELSCWSGAEQKTAVSLIRYAAKTLSARPKTTVYLDAGNAAWQPAHTMVDRLRRAGVGSVRGFSLNVSSFVNNSKTIAYGNRIAKALGGKHYVIDTGRNGRGAYRQDGAVQWCNPPGRALGADPTTDTASPLIDAYLWVKAPGESDGPCNGGPGAGVWWPAYALGLARR